MASMAGMLRRADPPVEQRARRSAVKRYALGRLLEDRVFGQGRGRGPRHLVSKPMKVTKKRGNQR